MPERFGHQPLALGIGTTLAGMASADLRRANAGLVLLAWEGRRDLAILLAAAGGVALSIATLP